MLGVRRDDALGAEGSHVQPHGGGAGASVVGEDERTRGGGGVLFEVGDVEHARGGWCVFGAVRKVDAGVGEGSAVEADGGVLWGGAAYGDGSGDGFVGDRLAAYINGALGGGVGRDGRWGVGSEGRGWC